MRFLFLLPLCAALFLLPGPCSCVGRPAEPFPNPQRDLEQCGLVQPAWICDPDHVLSSVTEREKVQHILNDIYENVQVECPDGSKKGFQVGVALVEKMMIGWADVEDMASKYASKIGRQWGVGHAGCDNEVMFFMSLRDRVVHIKTARQAAMRVSDYDIDGIIESMKPSLRAGKYDKAVQGGLILLKRELQKPPRQPVDISFVFSAWVVPIFVVVMVLVCGGWRVIAALLIGMFMGLASLIGHAIATVADCCRNMLVKRERAEAQAALDRVANELGVTPSAPPLDPDAQPSPVTAPSPSDSPTHQSQAIYHLVEDNTSHICPICLEDLIPPRTDKTGTKKKDQKDSGKGGSGGVREREVKALPCGHRFHKVCVDEWLRAGGATCPLCRAEAGDDDTGPPLAHERPDERRYRRRVEYFLRRLAARFPRTLGRSDMGAYRTTFMGARPRPTPHTGGGACFTTYQPPVFIHVPPVPQPAPPPVRVPLPTFEQTYNNIRWVLTTPVVPPDAFAAPTTTHRPDTTTQTTQPHQAPHQAHRHHDWGGWSFGHSSTGFGGGGFSGGGGGGSSGTW
ncbi:unnamed protein product [Vitrella brassicaformis CCMP3155]|uniref:RING-type domain-containing protein n=2 Tax=Vitrella brassicaformis TaxID=1169539 RepID=A0A0G4FVK8_VITBC|nr:unnamed protein product [Vitrella brassicaformis CCMP3155]|eukprot:CEM18748.1 unnamed protein product [Vitrella brassicaformis CCMP3155]